MGGGHARAGAARGGESSASARGSVVEGQLGVQRRMVNLVGDNKGRPVPGEAIDDGRRGVVRRPT